ncbi:MAG: oxidoreductase [Burkholderiales bacterium]|nr:oxidoreductase [Burkholderiales bacterium]
MSLAQHRQWYEGLKALSRSDFPKRCACCGRVYASEADYFEQTVAIRGDRSGLKSAQDEEDGPLVELYRNCVCGSTLLAFFSDRRDLSDTGYERRELFEELLDYLERSGAERLAARMELLRVLQGQRSEMLEAWYARIAAEKRGQDSPAGNNL